MKIDPQAFALPARSANTLATSYLGLSLDNPVVASASPLNGNLDNLRRLEDFGAAAVVLPSLFQEQIEAQQASHIARTDAYADSSPEASSYFPEAASGPYGVGPQRYLELVRHASEALAIPVIASLNGATHAGWIDYARYLQQAGAAALELNMYHVPTDLEESGHDIESRYMTIVGAVCDSVTIPVSVKIVPYLSSLGHFATALMNRGAAGLVLFNRLLQPDIDLAGMRLTDNLGLTVAAELRLPLLWTAILSGRLSGSLAASGGVTTSDDVVKCVLAGADVVMTTSALLRNDIAYVGTLVSGLRAWMDEREFASVGDMRGLLSWERSADHSAYTRANYLRILESYSSAA